MAIRTAATALAAFAATAAAVVAAATAQELAVDDDIAPAPPSIGADVALTYFGPAPSSVDRRLVGPVQLLTAGVVDEDAGTVTLPLYYGSYADGEGHYYVLSDTSDEGNAKGLGLNPSAKLQYAVAGETTARLDGTRNILVGRVGKVDFTPVRQVVPAAEPAPFPPASFTPPQVGDEDYSPIVRLANVGQTVYNAPIVAGNVSDAFLNRFCDGVPDHLRGAFEAAVHSKVVRICPRDTTVTLELTPGFSFAKPVLYMSMDASAALAAAFEDITHAPALARIQLGGDDSAFSAVERLFAIVNGLGNGDLPPGAPLNATTHPGRQGFFSAIRGEGSPLNILGGIPSVATDYSPLWDVNLGRWTDYAVAANLRHRLVGEFLYLGQVARGYITAPDGGAFGSSGIIVNCPIVQRFL